jgi:hypothetical protein
MRQCGAFFVVVAAAILSVVCYGALGGSWMSTPVRDAMTLARPGSHTGAPPPTPTYNVASLPTLKPGGELKFGVGQDNRALLSGWSAPEMGGVWSAANDASIGFTVQCTPVDCPTEDPILLFSGVVYVVPGHFSQTIEAWVGDKQVDEAKLSPATPNTEFVIVLKGLAVSDRMPIVLLLHLPDAIRQENDSKDGPKLALRIASLRFDPSH